MVGGPCRRHPRAPAPDAECGSAHPGRRNENAPERRSHVHGHGRVIYVASGRHRTGRRSCVLLCLSQKTVGRFQGWTVLFYVGLTQCKLHDRAREHVTAARERSRSSALVITTALISIWCRRMPTTRTSNHRLPSRCCLNTRIYCTSISRKQWRSSC